MIFCEKILAKIKISLHRSVEKLRSHKRYFCLFVCLGAFISEIELPRIPTYLLKPPFYFFSTTLHFGFACQPLRCTALALAGSFVSDKSHLVQASVSSLHHSTTPTIASVNNAANAASHKSQIGSFAFSGSTFTAYGIQNIIRTKILPISLNIVLLAGFPIIYLTQTYPTSNT